HLAIGQAESAAECFSSCIALRKEFAPAWYQRSLAYARLHFNDMALEDCDRAIELDPDFARAYIQRAALRQVLNRWEDSLADLERVAKCSACPSQVYFLRAKVRDKLGDRAGAAEDFTRGLKTEPGDDVSFLTRAIALEDADPRAALADVERALKLNAISPDALQEKAHILSVLLNRHAEAMKVLNQIVELHPDHAPALAGRGVLLARQGKR